MKDSSNRYESPSSDPDIAHGLPWRLWIRIAGLLTIGVGAIALLIAALMLVLASLGYMGVLADVSLDENREFASQILVLAIPMSCGGLLVFAFGIGLVLSTKRPN